MDTEATPIELAPEERELLLQELEAYLSALPEERHVVYQALVTGVQAGRVPAEHTGALGELLALSLMSGRASRRYTAEGERILTALFRRTPVGAAVEAQLASINRALQALRNQRVQGVRVHMRTLGHFTLAIQTETAGITLAFRPEGVDVESVTTGG